jgi:two-component system response regulator AtoC
VRIAGSVRTALGAVAQADAHVAIVDLMLPDGDGLALTRELKTRDPAMEVIVITAYGSVKKAMEATKGAGAFHVVEKPFEPDEVLGLVKTALEHRKLSVENVELRRRLVEQTADSEILGSAPGIQRVMETIASVADTDANVLIIGESGTGKELIANALHERSARHEGPWIKINCAALPKDLIESELFGHTKGSFTGATTEKVGLLEEAHKGSLLLDEITEMPVHLQAKLLRVLETGIVFRVGGSTQLRTNVRVLAATNRDPQEAIRQGKLRGDLFFRLAVFSIRLPALRERQGDVSLLATHFLARLNEQNGTDKTWASGALAELEQREWKGNVRELKNAVQRAYILSNTELKSIDAVSAPSAAEAKQGGTTLPIQVGSTIADAERELILATLEHVGGNKPAAAKMLGISLKTLYIRLNLYRVAKG